MLDLGFVRHQFPALATPWALFDNAGGSVPARAVVARVRAYMEQLGVQLGASHALSIEAGASVDAGRAVAARLFGARPDETVLGASSTVLAQRLAAALRPTWEAGDEVVITDLDHEANAGPWRRMRDSGIEVREWRMRPETARLELEDLEPLLGPRTRLVAFTHCANVVGSIHDVEAITARVRAAGALSCVDGVAFAPHRRVDVAALGCDFYLISLYKVFGPHVGALFGRAEALRAARNQNHDFVGEDEVPYKLEPGSVPHELAAGLVGIDEYLRAFAEHHALPGDPYDAAFAAFAAHEGALVEPVLQFLAEHPRTRVVGEPSADPSRRVATVAFTVDGMRSAELPPRLDARRVAVRFGHFYAPRAMRALGLEPDDGIVRASLLHYNTPDEVSLLIDALAEALA